MTAHTANGFAFLLRASVVGSQDVAESVPARRAGSPGTRHGGKGGLGNFLTRAIEQVREWRRRSAVMNELAGLSDRDLADIGLARGDIPHIFDRGFARRYEQERAAL